MKGRTNGWALPEPLCSLIDRILCERDALGGLHEEITTQGLIETIRWCCTCYNKAICCCRTYMMLWLQAQAGSRLASGQRQTGYRPAPGRRQAGSRKGCRRLPQTHSVHPRGIANFDHKWSSFWQQSQKQLQKNPKLAGQPVRKMTSAQRYVANMLALMHGLARITSGFAFFIVPYNRVVESPEQIE